MLLIDTMDLAICISVKNRSNLYVKSEPINNNGRIPVPIQNPSEKIDSHNISPDGLVHLTLLPNMLRSLVNVKRDADRWTVILVDYGSTDIDIDAMCLETLGTSIPYIISKQTDKFFDRGGGLDIGANIAKERGIESLFFCDADMYFTSHYIFDKALETLTSNKIYYPICFSLTGFDHTHGHWRSSGYGMVFIKLTDYFNSERWKHNRSWGYEDYALLDSLPKNKIERSNALGFFHQWHPNDITFKTREYEIKYSTDRSRAIY